MADQHALRRRLRQLRQAISEQTRSEATSRALDRIARHPAFRRAKRVAAYVGSKGELDPMPLLRTAARKGKRCFLPVLHPFLSGRLWFCQWQPGDRLVRNRFDIPEPGLRRCRHHSARQLDLVIVPLLGFDDQCHRLGMGGGYYDRSFAFVRRLRHVRRPYLLGLALELQRVDRIQINAWDVPLDAVVTERSIYSVNKESRTLS
ncbi:MAG: 5-formyltetrahydrofolate cyclo-ligase [Chromatiaceae bacterium]|nr:5-formyltetrahydrofolate cyclo-ligase [Gammaproteobacteria bacterium]MCP5304832.1 5-formyltetrahydrofolate cyclo-ligase [Chromatiaceae bacterium]MCP5314791.1 5-formyltetrahydrofolate cyclo-ligase [Chromatiaceae bacterium]